MSSPMLTDKVLHATANALIGPLGLERGMRHALAGDALEAFLAAVDRPALAFMVADVLMDRDLNRSGMNTAEVRAKVRPTYTKDAMAVVVALLGEEGGDGDD